ncbi:MAG: mannose-1-phosphate guanylyltransferase [Gammaproteobacteria bacterium]|nr:mannose-1-phosphate guanylyltransferase [Gammaproteobacteria bacterium]
MKAMILAAGFGTRMGPITKLVPKPLIKINDKTLLEENIEKLASIGVKEIIINVSWLADKIIKRVGDGKSFGIKILWSKEDQPLDTGGGIYNVLPLLGEEPFFVANADVWVHTDAYKGLLDYYQSDMKGLLLMVKNPQHNKDGDFSLNDGLVGFGPSKLTFSGLSILSKSLFEHHNSSVAKFSLKNIFDFWINKKKLSGLLYHGYWNDVGTPDRREMLEEYLNSKGRSAT